MINKYEIMAIVDPKTEVSEFEAMLKEVFGAGVKSVETMENNELAYEINKSKIAHRVLVNVEAEGDRIAEFTRKANIAKYVWRNIVINLDTERGFGKEAKPRSFRKPAQRTQRAPRPRKQNVEEN